ncbi:hypothetical protein D3C80_1717370 [compost metagenome]
MGFLSPLFGIKWVFFFYRWFVTEIATRLLRMFGFKYAVGSKGLGFFDFQLIA